MIVFEESRLPVLRAGEFEVAGRRAAVRALPYVGDVGEPRFGFDPVERRFVARKPEGTIHVGPHEAEAWRVALARSPAGPALVGPGNAVEEIRGAYRAAAEGALLAGRAVYLLDPEPAGLPAEPGHVFVALFCWLPGQPAGVAAISGAISRGIPAGWLLPLIPGWTVEPNRLEEAVRRAIATGARFLAPILPDSGGQARRSIVEARGEAEPESAEQFFERVHHGDWEAEVGDGLRRLYDACARAGLSSVPPRPVGLSEPVGNAAAAGRLEEKARAMTHDEHRASLLHAAARWIDESGRDLARIAREGNFRKVFPFGPDLAREAEEAFTGTGA